MALYNDGSLLVHEDSPMYHTHLPPGAPTPVSGVYRCRTCGKSVTSIKSRPLPPQHASHRHPGPIDWQLVVKSHLVGGE